LEGLKFVQLNVHLPSSDPSDERIPITEEYLAIIDAIADNEQLPVSWLCLSGAVSKEIRVDLPVRHSVPHTRAGNVDRIRQLKGKIRRSKVGQTVNEDALVSEDLAASIQSGVVYCGKNLNENVLLPNGDVVICCNDYGLEHRMGNLLENSYDSLFTSQGYLSLQAKMSKGGSDVLCPRGCRFAYTGNLSRFLNSKHVYAIRASRGSKDVFVLGRRVLGNLCRGVFSPLDGIRK
jgi:hypothetical protein